MADKKKSDTASEETEIPVETGVDGRELAEEFGTDRDDANDRIEEAEILEEIPSDDDPDRDQARPPEGMEADELTEPEDPEEIEDLAALDGADDADLRGADEGRDDHQPTPETVEETSDESPADAPGAPEPVREIERETVVVERKGAVVPGFLGGAIAAVGMLFAAPYVVPPKFFPANPEIRETMTRQSETIAALEAEIAALQGQVSEAASVSALTALSSETAAERARLSEALEALSAEAARSNAVDEVAASVAAMSDRITTLEKRPVDEAPDPAAIAAVEAYSRELAELRETVTAQMQEADALVKEAAAAADRAVQEAVATSNAAIEDAEAAARAAREQAEAEAAAAAEKALQAARAQALVDIQAALEDGSAFGDVLPMLDGIDVPDALVAASDGVETLPGLRDAFTLAAREALTVARTEASDGSATDRASAWIQNQLGVRSLSPGEGDDPDAVLSRAEAALSEARLEDAIAELSTLPEGGRSIMADWISLAAARAEALAAADELAASLAAN